MLKYASRRGDVSEAQIIRKGGNIQSFIYGRVRENCLDFGGKYQPVFILVIVNRFFTDSVTAEIEKLKVFIP